MAGETENRDHTTHQTDTGVKRRGLLRFGTLITAFTGASAISAIGATSAVAGPGDKTPPTAYIPTSEKGAPLGVATLDIDSKIPCALVPDLSATYDRKVSTVDLREYTHPHATADATAAITEAIAATPIGGTCLIPDGTWRASGINVNRSIRLKLTAGAVLKANDNATAHTIIISAPDVTIDLGINGTIDNNRAVVPASQAKACILGLDSAPRATVKGGHLTGSNYHGVWLQGTNSKAVKVKTTNTFAVGILLSSDTQNTYDMKVIECLVDRTSESPNTITNSGIQVRGGSSSDAWSTFRPTVKDCDVLLPWDPADSLGYCTGIELGAGSHRGKVVGCTVTGGGIGISLAHADSGKVSDNDVNGANLYAIEVADSAHCAVVNNTVDGGGITGKFGSSAIVTTGQVGLSTYLTITGNTVMNLHDRGNAIGISAGAGAAIVGNTIEAPNGIVLSDSGCTVTGNRINGKGYTASSGVIVNAQSYETISGNNIRAFENAVELRAIAAGSVIDDIQIIGNPIRNVTREVYRRTAGTATIGNRIEVVSAISSPTKAMGKMDTGEETFPALYATASLGLDGSGSLNLSYFTAQKTGIVNKLGCSTMGTGAAATPTLCRIGLYTVAANGDLTLVASTSNDTTVFSGTFAKIEKATTAAYEMIAGRAYAIGILVVSASALPNFLGSGTPPQITGSKGPGRTYRQKATGYTDLPATVAAGSLSNSSTGPILMWTKP